MLELRYLLNFRCGRCNVYVTCGIVTENKVYIYTKVEYLPNPSSQRGQISKTNLLEDLYSLCCDEKFHLKVGKYFISIDSE